MGYKIVTSQTWFARNWSTHQQANHARHFANVLLAFHLKVFAGQSKLFTARLSDVYRFTDRQQLEDKAAVEALKNRILSALCRQNKSSPILLSKVLTKLAELRSLNDSYSRFLTLSPPKSPSNCESDRESLTTEFSEEGEALVVRPTVLPNHKITVV